MGSQQKGPALDAPQSDNTVRVRMVDTTASMYLHARSFVEPVVPGHERMNMSDMAFLIENERMGRKAMFDLGVRKDFWNLPPKIATRLDVIAMGLSVEQGVPSILQGGGIELQDVNDVILSHTHWDHTGDVSLFPSSTNVHYHSDIVALLPGYPEDRESRIPSSDYTNRKNFVVSFKPISEGQLTIGGLPAHDFYGDGSLYLLYTPGHSPGHLAALARTTPTTFIFMGGDACHFCGDMRPNLAYSLPSHPKVISHTVPSDPLLEKHPGFAPGPPRDDDEKAQRAHTNWYRLSSHARSSYDDPDESQVTVTSIRRFFDQSPDVLVALAHDCTLPKVLPTFNHDPAADLNDWQAKGWKEACQWGWISELHDATPIVEGFWRDGKRYKNMKELVDDLPPGEESNVVNAGKGSGKL